MSFGAVRAKFLRGWLSRSSRPQPGDLPGGSNRVEVTAYARGRSSAEVHLDRVAAGERDRDGHPGPGIPLQVGLVDTVDRRRAAGVPGAVHGGPQTGTDGVADVGLQRDDPILGADRLAWIEAVVGSEHCIASGIISDEHLPRVVGRLFSPDMFSGWGVRTLSSSHRAYNPLSYHLGTVWTVEQGTIAFGLRRFGFDTRALDIAQALFDLARLYPEYRIPECIGGYARSDPAGPGAYPRANTPQLWNASAFPLLIHTVLGFQPVGPLETLIVDPVLPTWLPELVVHDLRLADAKATLRFWRDDSGSSHVEVVHKRGTFRILKQPPPESLKAHVFDRLGALFDSVRH